MERIKIGYKDKEGTDIRTGDIVEFRFCADHPDNDKCECGSLMRDIVINADGESYFLEPETDRAAYAWRHHDKCKVVGQMLKDAELLKKIFVAPENYEPFIRGFKRWLKEKV